MAIAQSSALTDKGSSPPASPRTKTSWRISCSRCATRASSRELCDDLFETLEDWGQQNWATLERRSAPLWFAYQGKYLTVGCQRCKSRTEEMNISCDEGKAKADRVLRGVSAAMRQRLVCRKRRKQAFVDNAPLAFRGACWACGSCSELCVPLTKGFELNWKIPETFADYENVVQSLQDRGVLDQNEAGAMTRLSYSRGMRVWASMEDTHAPLFIVYHNVRTSLAFIQFGCRLCRKQSDRIFINASPFDKAYARTVLLFMLRGLEARPRTGLDDRLDAHVPSEWGSTASEASTPSEASTSWSRAGLGDRLDAHVPSSRGSTASEASTSTWRMSAPSEASTAWSRAHGAPGAQPLAGTLCGDSGGHPERSPLGDDALALPEDANRSRLLLAHHHERRAVGEADSRHGSATVRHGCP